MSLEDKLEKLRLCQLQFIGKILSLFTHQLNNHLAIIKDSVGFLDDLIRLKGQLKDDIDEITKTMAEVEEEINRATILSKKLNSFGHRMDSSFSSFSINDILEELLILVSRITIQKRLTFMKDFSPDVPIIYNDPGKVHFLLYCFLDRLLKKMEPGARMKVITKVSGKGCAVDFIIEGGVLESDDISMCSDDIIEYTKDSLGCKMIQSNVNSVSILFEGME